jgi:hypothetical protein
MQKENFLRELQKSLTYIENLLTTSINFEGIAPSLLIDELQFLLNPGCIAIDSPVKSYANILPYEQELLQDCTKDFPWKEGESKMPFLQFSCKKFQPIRELYKGSEPFRLALREVTAAYAFALQTDWGKWRVTIYCDPDSISFPFWEFLEFFEFVTKALEFTSIIFNTTQPAQHGRLDRLYSRVEESQYLESILENLAQRIVDHLSKANHRFAEFAKNPLFLQYFFITGDYSPESHKPWLRFFLLRNQRQRLRDSIEIIREKLKSNGLLEPPDIEKFVTKDYRWNSDSAFVGYSCETGTSLYLSDWENEPIAKGVHLSGEEQQNRRIATTIMQALRDEPPNLLILPLFADRQAIGVLVINCPEDVELSPRILTIRSTRDVGYLLSLALQMDDLVNRIQEEKRKAAQAQSYRHVTQSLLHSEGTYCMELEAFLEQLKETGSLKDPSLAPFVKRISYFVRDKNSLDKEFSATDDPVREIPLEFIYPTYRGIQPESAVIPVSYLTEMSTLLRDLFCRGREGNLKVDSSFGSLLKSIGKIVNLEYYVVARVVANLIRNSSRVATERNIQQPKLRLTFEILRQENREVLQITAEDNCKGFSDDMLAKTKGNITFDSWSSYLNAKDKDEKNKISRGMGFFMFAKYTTAIGGFCHIANILQPEKGASVELLLPLHSSLGRR